MKTTTLSLALVAAFLVLSGSAAAEDDAAAGIQWYGTWDAAKAEAKRTERPILLVAAAPHCRNVCGVW